MKSFIVDGSTDRRGGRNRQGDGDAKGEGWHWMGMGRGRVMNVGIAGDETHAANGKTNGIMIIG